jgi:hypothetical protein
MTETDKTIYKSELKNILSKGYNIVDQDHYKSLNILLGEMSMMNLGNFNQI